MKTKEVDMLSGSVTKGLITLTLPIIITNVGQVLFNIVDMAVLKNFSDDGAVGAVGESGMLITLCISLLIGISVGANVVVAKKIGMNNRESVTKAVGTAVAFSFIGGLILMIIGAVFAKNIFENNKLSSKIIIGSYIVLQNVFLRHAFYYAI